MAVFFFLEGGTGFVVGGMAEVKLYVRLVECQTPTPAESVGQRLEIKFRILVEIYPENPVEVLEKAIANISPDFEVKSRRVGGANYQIPFPIAGHRQLHFAFSWLVQSARGRAGMPYAKRLEAEIVDAYNETGAAFKKKEDCHRMAEANRAFAHFARG